MKNETEIQVKGRVTFNILPGGEYVNALFEFDEPTPQALQDWLKFAYCNDLVWDVHAMQGDATKFWMSTVRFEFYRHLFRHIHGDQYLVPEPPL